MLTNYSMKLFSTRSLVLSAAVCVCSAGCNKSSAATPSPGPAPVADIAAASHAEGAHFKVDASPAGPCDAGAACAVAIRLEAMGDYHINQEYPHKFTARDVPGVEFLGKDPASKNVFSSQTGDLTLNGEKVATMNVRFKPSANGTLAIAGTYKLAVCSAQTCEIEKRDLTT